MDRFLPDTTPPRTPTVTPRWDSPGADARGRGNIGSSLSIGDSPRASELPKHRELPDDSASAPGRWEDEVIGWNSGAGTLRCLPRRSTFAPSGLATVPGLEIPEASGAA